MRLVGKTYLLLCALIAPGHAAATSRQLPVVDLGYELHQAASYNQFLDVYTFSNIRYAQPPVGELRFRAPLPPLTNRSAVQVRSNLVSCPQGAPSWQAKAFVPIGMYSAGKPFSLQSWEEDVKNATIPQGLDLNAHSSEDCLFLDVHVPRSIFQNAKKNSHKECDAPVLVWIHGGGYALGSKNGVPTPGYDPSGLLKHAKAYNDEGIIFVALNYRLGAPGFLASPEVKEDGDLNAGLLDQRLALDWVQDNVHLFGGSPDKVTIMGESAGGGSVLLQLFGSSYQDGLKSPFSQVIAQSPAIMPTVTPPESAFRDFLSILNVSTLAEARQLSPEAIIQANAQQIGAAPPTTYVHGPVLDGRVIPAHPLDLFKRGEFDTTVKLLAAHNSFEGGFFYDPSVTTNAEFLPWIQRSVPGLNKSQQEDLANTIYPPSFKSGIGYSDQSSRQMSLWGEAVIDCTFLAINEALKGKSYAYQFNVSPGLHTQDLKYTFNDPTSPPFAPVAQDILQQILTSFVIDGVPSASEQHGHSKQLPHWGADKALTVINSNNFEFSHNTVNHTRCGFWQNALG